MQNLRGERRIKPFPLHLLPQGDHQMPLENCILGITLDPLKIMGLKLFKGEVTTDFSGTLSPSGLSKCMHGASSYKLQALQRAPDHEWLGVVNLLSETGSLPWRNEFTHTGGMCTHKRSEVNGSIHSCLGGCSFLLCSPLLNPNPQKACVINRGWKGSL